MRVSNDDIRKAIETHLNGLFVGRELTEAVQAEVQAELAAIIPLLRAASSDQEPTAV